MEEFLFNPSVLDQLNFSSVESSFSPHIDVLKPGDGLIVRPLKISDYDVGFLDCLKQLTVVGKVTKDQFEATFKKMKNLEGMYFVVVIEDRGANRVIGSATLFIEQKFIHDCAVRGRIEDVVVDSGYRGKQLGKVLIHSLVLLSKHLQCYKVTLDCNDARKGFYESFGFKKEEGNSNFMQIRF